MDVLRTAANQEVELDALDHAVLKVMGQLTGLDVVHGKLFAQMFEDVTDVLSMLCADRGTCV